MIYLFYYRLFFKINNQEYSYVGSTQSFKKTLKEHLSYLKKVLNLNEDNNVWAQKFYQLVISRQELPREKSLYYKLALFMLKHNLTLKDLHTETLTVSEDQIIKKNYHQIKRSLIKKYHGFTSGFNDLFQTYTIYVNEEEKDDYNPNDHDFSVYQYQNLQIATKILKKRNLKEYFEFFWYRYLNFENSIINLASALDMKELALELLTKLQLFSTNNKPFINQQIKFYQDRYQKTNILKQIKTEF